MNRTLFAVIGVTLAIIVAAIVLVVVPGKMGAPSGSVSKGDLIRVSSPLPGQKVSLPLLIRGEARGTWYFEATFPVTISTQDGTTIAAGFGQAQGDWMTEEYVPFVATIDIPDRPAGAAALPVTITLHKSNASGLPEQDDSLSFEVVI